MKSIGATSRSSLWLSEKKLSSIMLIIGASLLLALLVGVSSFLLIQDKLEHGKFPQGVSIVGVDVSGLTPQQAVSRCKVMLADIANTPLTLKVDDEEYQVPPQDIGLVLEYEQMVKKAYSEAWSVNLFERMGRRFLNRPKEINVSLMASNEDAKVQAFVNQAMMSINREPHDAYVDVTNGVPVIVKEKDGRQADVNQLLESARAALATEERVVDVQVQRTPAALTEAIFGKLILINLASHRLYLYDREQLLAEFPIACGTARYPTPPGQWKVVSKQRNPAWINPKTAWAASMPPYIPPGPGNPLGTRALALNASGVLIHGTSSSWSIGHSASHGCIRMYMSDVERLFEMVETNTPVYIIKAPGNPGFDVTRKPFWW